jgi:hypothetical protein
MNANRTTALAAILLAIVLATPRARADAREHPDLVLFFQAASPESAEEALVAEDDSERSWPRLIPPPERLRYGTAIAFQVRLKP